mmetsp:Transcript_26390/g.68239  ORF Transcript_26390/g.68239 Transcript_26390/m.68239 type:complete len:206 (+) Transcript_26390:951-1568(+)
MRPRALAALPAQMFLWRHGLRGPQRPASRTRWTALVTADQNVCRGIGPLISLSILRRQLRVQGQRQCLLDPRLQELRQPHADQAVYGISATGKRRNRASRGRSRRCQWVTRARRLHGACGHRQWASSAAELPWSSPEALAAPRAWLLKGQRLWRLGRRRLLLQRGRILHVGQGACVKDRTTGHGRKPVTHGSAEGFENLTFFAVF